jgi:IMP dehydrogenase
MQRAVCFDDVLLIPQFSDIESRSHVDLSVTGFESSFTRLTDKHEDLKCPIVGSPMDTVMGPQSAATIAKFGGFGILHRYCSIEDSKQMFFETISLMSDELDDVSQHLVQNVMVAIGTTNDYLERATELYNAGCRAFCIDVAHGHHINVKNALNKLRSKFGKKIHVMTGNVATLEAFNDLADWGSDSIRTGVGGGSMCTTRIRTGHGVPTLQSIIDCSKSDRDVHIIADGGIRNSGDAVKALAAGADMVMLGSILAGHDESPGTIIIKDHQRFKKFRGMASREAQLEWRGKVSVAEGESTLIPYKGSLSDTLNDLLEGIRSGLSYSGARTIRELRAKSKFTGVTPSGVLENGPHGKKH